MPIDLISNQTSLFPGFTALLNKDGHFLEANPAWEQILGWDLPALKQSSFFQLVHEQDHASTQTHIQKLLSGEKTVTFENRVLRKDSSCLWIRWNGRFLSGEGRFYLMGQDVTELKEAEKNLEESRRKFNRLAESATEGVAIHEKGVILEANQALARMFGYHNPEEIVGLNGLDFTAPEYRQLILQNIAAGSEEPYEVVGLRKDGSRFHCLIQGKTIAYQGRTVRVSTFLDITHVKKREEELFESQELFRKVAEASQDGIAVSEKGKILVANPALAKMFGCEVSGMIGRNALEFSAPESREVLISKITSESEASYEVIGLRRNGTRFPLRVSARMTTYQGRRVRLAFFRDLTENKKIEAEVLRQKEFSQNLINSSIDGLLAYDLECRYTLWNPAMERISGVSREEVLGQSAFDVFPFLKQIGEDYYFHESLRGKVCVSKDRPYRTPVGKEGFFEAAYSPLRNPQGEVIGGLAVIRDITGRKKAEGALRQSETNLRAVFESTFQNIIIVDRE